MDPRRVRGDTLFVSQCRSPWLGRVLSNTARDSLVRDSSRARAASCLLGSDARGIVWPDAIAPFQVVLCPIGSERSEAVRTQADALHEQLGRLGIDVMLDDRGERPGAMFADWELIGVPHRVVVSERGLKEGMVEYQGRRDATATAMTVDAVLGKFTAWRQQAAAPA